jgi:hypothetical protein
MRSKRRNEVIIVKLYIFVFLLVIGPLLPRRDKFAVDVVVWSSDPAFWWRFCSSIRYRNLYVFSSFVPMIVLRAAESFAS